MNINRFRKKALSASTLVRAYAGVLGRAANKGKISAKDIDALNRIKARLDNNVEYTDRLGNKTQIQNYLGESLGKKFDQGTRQILFGGNSSITKDKFIKALGDNKLQEMPYTYRDLRSLLHDIHKQHIPKVDSKNMHNAWYGKRRYFIWDADEFKPRLAYLKRRINEMPKAQMSPVEKYKKQLGNTLAKLNKKVREPNSKLKSYAPNQIILEDRYGRKYYRDKHGMYFTQVLTDDAGKNIYKVTRLLNKNKQLIPDYRSRGKQYWSEEGKRLVPGDVIEENGKIKQPWNYEDDNSRYAILQIADVTPIKAKSQAQSSTGVSSKPTETPTVEASSGQTPKLPVRPDANGNAMTPGEAHVGSIYGQILEPINYWWGSNRKVKPQQPIDVGGTTGAQSRAANQTAAKQTTQALAPQTPEVDTQQKLPFFERLMQGTRQHFSNNRGVYGTLGGATVGSLVTNMLSGGGSGISQEDLLRMSQWQQAYTMALDQRSFWQRLFGDMQSVQVNFQNNLKNYGWTDQQIKAYRKRFAGVK